MTIHPKLRAAVDAAVQASDHGCLTQEEAKRLRELEAEAQRAIAAEALEAAANDLAEEAAHNRREALIGDRDQRRLNHAEYLYDVVGALLRRAGRIRKGEM